MKHILQSVLLFSFAATAFAQSVEIGYPPDGTQVQPGQEITVQIVQPDGPERSYTLGIALGIRHCIPGAYCPPPSDEMGTVLYNGPFDPQPYPGSQPYQNFTVTIPSDIDTGTAQLNVAYAALWGAEAKPGFDTISEILVVVNA